MSLPKLPTNNSSGVRSSNNKPSQGWLLQESKKSSQASLSQSSSGPSMDNSYPKLSTESFNSNFSQVWSHNDRTMHYLYVTIFQEYFSPKKKSSYHRSVNAYYKHIERINLERTQSLTNMLRPARSGKPAILKPLKLWRQAQPGKEKLVWVYGNPWSQTEPKYLKTGGQLTKLPDTPLKTSSLSNIVLGKKIESPPVETESAKVRSEEEVASINEKVDIKEIKLKKKTNFSKNLNSSKQKIINTSTSNLNPEVSKSDANESLKEAENVEQIEIYDEKDKNNDDASHDIDEKKNLINVEETSSESKELESRDENDEDANDPRTNDDPTESSSHVDSEQEEDDNKSEEIKLIEDDLHISDAEDQSYDDEEEKEDEDVQKNGEDHEEASVLTPQTNPKGLYNESDKVFEERNDILTLLEDSHGLDLTLQSQHSFDSAVDKFVSNVATKSMKDVNENLVDFNSFNWKPDVEFFKFSQGQSDSGVFTFDQSVAAPFSSQVSRKSGHLRERLKMKRK